jgi:hypothetical protein
MHAVINSPMIESLLLFSPYVQSVKVVNTLSLQIKERYKTHCFIQNFYVHTETSVSFFAPFHLFLLESFASRRAAFSLSLLRS